MFNQLLKNQANFKNTNSISYKLRKKRMDFFIKYLSSFKLPIKLLDIGGTVSYWEKMGFANNKNFQITVLNIKKTKSGFNNIDNVEGNAIDMKEYKENQFDIVFSNSVIEHLGTLENQKKWPKK